MPTKDQIEAAALCMEHLVDHDWHGYTWDYRWGDGEGTCEVDTPIGPCYVEQGDRDCSSSIISAYEAAGIDTGGATYTGNMRELMCGTGNFVAHRMSNGYGCDDGYVPQRGDCVVNTIEHTAFILGGGQIAEFSINEFGGVYGGQTGDQTDRESHRGSYYGFPWNWCIQPICEDGEPVDTVPVFVKYQASTDPNGVSWLPPMHDLIDTGGSTDDFAGEFGQPIRWFAMLVPGGVKYRACTQASGWLPWVECYDVNDLENGCAGDGSPITGIEIAHNGVRFAVHPVGFPAQLWYDDMIGQYDTGGSDDKYGGDLVKPIDAIRMQRA